MSTAAPSAPAEKPAPTDVNAQREASVIVGVSKPAAPARKRTQSRATRAANKIAAKPAARKSASKPAAKPAPKPAPKSASKPASKPAGERTASQRKVSVMNMMIHACADLVRSDAAFKTAQRRYPDLRDVMRTEAAAFLAARLSYAPGDEWDSALPAPTQLQAGKRSKTRAA